MCLPETHAIYIYIYMFVLSINVYESRQERIMTVIGKENRRRTDGRTER